MSKTVCILLADEGSNLKLAENLKTYLESKGAKTHLINLITFELPLYTFKTEAEMGIVPNATKLVEYFKGSDSFLVVSPEYNGTMPPVLSSAICWATRATKEWRSCFNEKPTGIASYSYTGANNLFASLRIHLSYIGLNVLARPIPATPDKPMLEEDMIAVCDQLLK